MRWPLAGKRRYGHQKNGTPLMRMLTSRARPMPVALSMSMRRADISHSRWRGSQVL